jgi:DNA-binding NtrC family response regulator
VTETSATTRILVVDDEPLIRWALAETLTQAGYSVVEAGSAKEALERLSGGWIPDVIFLDFRLPDSDNLGLLESIRRQVPSSHVIMMTAFGTPEMVAGAERLGARVIDKPLHMNAVVPLVNQVETPSTSATPEERI